MPSNVSSEYTMMKRGTKRKIEIKKRDTKLQRSVACSKRRQTLFSKAADLCLLSGSNIAVFVTSPAENSDVVYSFSGYSPASEIADCYLNGKTPPKVSNSQSKFGFWWEDPDLYRYCDDLSELNIIEDRLMRTKKHLMACLEKKEKSQFVSNSDQNPSIDELFNGGSSSSQIASDFGQSTSSLDLTNPKSSSPSSSQITYFDQNCGGSSSQFVSDFDQNPNFTSPSLSQIASFEQNSYYTSLEKICAQPSSSQVTCYDQNPSSFFVDGIYGGESSSDEFGYLVNKEPGCVDSLWETEKENNRMSLSQETQTQSINNEDQSIWENLYNAFCLNNNNLQVQTVEDIYGESSSDQSRYLVNEDPGFVDSLCETEEENNGMSLPQETQTQSIMINEDQSFWENVFNDDDNVFGLNNDNNINLEVPVPDHSSINEEEELMIDISEYLSDEGIKLLQC